MLVSSVKQSDLVIHIYIFMFFSIIVYYKILNIVPYAIQEDLVVYLNILYIVVVSANPRLLIYPSPPSFLKDISAS